MSDQLVKAIADLSAGLKNYPVWFALAWQEVKQRYRRSVLGPIWITISMGVMLTAMGPLYGSLLNQELGPYFRSLAIGFVLWNFIASCLNESCAAFISAEGFIKQVKLPFSIHLLKVLMKNVIILGHNIVIVIGVLVLFPPENFSHLPLVAVGFCLVTLNLFWIGLVLAILCTRFRDVAQLVANILQILFFLTPILWPVNLLGNKRYVADWNIFYHFMEVVREPLLGGIPNITSWISISLMGGSGLLLALAFFARYRARISYWI